MGKHNALGQDIEGSTEAGPVAKGEELELECWKPSPSAEVRRALFRRLWTIVVIGIMAIGMAAIGVGVIWAGLKVVASNGADFMMAYSTLTTIVSCFKLVLSFLFFGVAPLISAASSAREHKRVGQICRVTLSMCACCGLSGSVLIYSLRVPMLELFVTQEADMRTVLALGERVLTLISVGFSFDAMSMGTCAIFIGLMYLPQLISLVILAHFVFLAILVLLLDSHGLVAFGWAYVASQALIFLGTVCILFAPRSRRERYDLCSWLGTESEVLLGILSQIGWAGVCSLCTHLRSVLSVILMSRMGIDYGASYAVLRVKGSFATITVTYYSIGFTLFGSRLWANGFRELTLVLLDWFNHLAGLVAACFVVIFGMGGPRKLVGDAVDDVSDEHIISSLVFALFCLNQATGAVASLQEKAVIAVGQSRYAGLVSMASFAVFLAVAVPLRSSFEAVYLAEAVYFSLRLLLASTCLLRMGWRPFSLCRFPHGVPLDDTFKALVEEVQGLRGRCRRQCRFHLLWMLLISSAVSETFADPLVIKMFGGGAQHKQGHAEASTDIGSTGGDEEAN